MPTTDATADARSEPRTHTDLVLEAIALRHQIAVAEAKRNPPPLFPSLGSIVLDLSVLVVAELAREPADRPTGNCAALVA